MVKWIKQFLDEYMGKLDGAGMIKTFELYGQGPSLGTILKAYWYENEVFGPCFVLAEGMGWSLKQLIVNKKQARV